MAKREKEERPVGQKISKKNVTKVKGTGAHSAWPETKTKSIPTLAAMTLKKKGYVVDAED